ncbi:Aristolochene synthase in complex with 12,13-Difluorofarnesyl diphosphate [Xylaria nigripes]|nr:Aristolochene synthase in complex with 12,13-Difluorofarnesyl diphosphate [Xylaria nigripes]
MTADSTIYPGSRFKAEIHPREPEVSAEVNGYFLKHWPFPDEAARKKFVAAGFPRVTCFYYPRALDDRIHFACRLLTVLFLIDDLLEDMSLEDGKAYNEKLMPIARGHVKPDRNIPVEYIFFDLWESMRAHDRELANEILEPTFEFMRAQTDPARLKPMGLKEYLEYREADVGKALLASLMRFSMALRIPADQLSVARPVDKNCSKHLSVINDIWSFEKEVLAAETAHAEGGFLCSAVSTMSGTAEISTDASKRILYGLCREWELIHDALVKEVLNVIDNSSIRAYLKGLELQMSGNEVWSKSTMRYLDPTM